MWFIYDLFGFFFGCCEHVFTSLTANLKFILFLVTFVHLRVVQVMISLGLKKKNDNVSTKYKIGLHLMVFFFGKEGESG
jgi:hypothetical protein